MKKILIYTLFSLAIFSGCKKDKEEVLIDGKRPEERVAESLEANKKELTGSEFGWKAYLYPLSGGGYSFYLKFDTANKVVMYADLDTDPAMTSMESTYKIKANQVNSLLFDTYNYMHILADPDPNTFGGAAGWGIYSDFEFNFDKKSGDTLMLTGKLLQSKLLLIKATKAEQDSYNSKGLYTSIIASIGYIDENTYLYVNLGDETKIQTTFDYYNKIFSFTWETDGVVNNLSTGFVFTLTGIILKEPLFYKDKYISEFTWDAAKGVFYAMVNGVRVELSASATPILPLNALIGISYTYIIVPNGTTYPGWSPDFIARRASVAAGTLSSGYNLRLDRIIFSFNTEGESMLMAADVYQNASKYIADFPYTFTKTTAGIYKFTAGTATGNAGLIVTQMAPLTTQRISTDNFRLDYFVNPQTGLILGQFISIEHPDFYFTGALQ